MIPLHARGAAAGVDETLLGSLAHHPAMPGAFLVSAPRGLDGVSRSRPLLLATRGADATDSGTGAFGSVALESLDHLAAGDIVAAHPSGRVDTLFRVTSPNNSLFVTERCNSRCLMCSQPPRDVRDIEYFSSLNRALVPLLPKSLETLGVTGGEPTLLGRHLLDLLRLVASELPETQLEILSNGRALSRPNTTRAIAAVATRRTLFTIPLYSDYPPQHDYIVQATDAFAQTVLGFHQLARYGVRSEVRVVLHRQSVVRLPALARFIQKNLPFVEHVALMGMEHTGYARVHDDALWIDPPDYADPLARATDILSAFGIPVSLYNLQPCLVPPDLRPFLRTSISDWKREYLPVCEGCSARERCGGVFGTSQRQSRFIRPIPAS